MRPIATYVAWSVCLSVCWTQRLVAVQKPMKRPRCRLRGWLGWTPSKLPLFDGGSYPSGKGAMLWGATAMQFFCYILWPLLMPMAATVTCMDERNMSKAIHMGSVPGIITFSCQSATLIVDATLFITRSLYRLNRFLIVFLYVFMISSSYFFICMFYCSFYFLDRRYTHYPLLLTLLHGRLLCTFQ